MLIPACSLGDTFKFDRNRRVFHDFPMSSRLGKDLTVNGSKYDATQRNLLTCWTFAAVFSSSQLRSLYELSARSSNPSETVVWSLATCVQLCCVMCGFFPSTESTLSKTDSAAQCQNGNISPFILHNTWHHASPCWRMSDEQEFEAS